MATTVTALANIAALWNAALSLWSDYASGTYTSWSYVYHSGFSEVAWDIEVGLSGGGSDIHRLVAMDLAASQTAPLGYLVNVPGFRSNLPTPFPDTLPDGSDCVSAFRSGPLALRVNMFSVICSSSPNLQDEQNTGTQFGVQIRFFVQSYTKNHVVVQDTIGVLHGTLTIDTYLGMPTDLIGGGTSVAVSSGGGGGSVDLTPVVDALEDIATREVNFSANQGGELWSCTGKVRAE